VRRVLSQAVVPEQDTDLSWTVRAACIGFWHAMDAPDLGDGGRLSVHDIYAAWRICALCPVLEECDRRAIGLAASAQERPWGVWGGRWWGARGVAKSCEACGSPVLYGKCSQTVSTRRPCGEGRYYSPRPELETAALLRLEG
jgi:hypothetical protein